MLGIDVCSDDTSLFQEITQTNSIQPPAPVHNDCISVGLTPEEEVAVNHAFVLKENRDWQATLPWGESILKITFGSKSGTREVSLKALARVHKEDDDGVERWDVVKRKRNTYLLGSYVVPASLLGTRNNKKSPTIWGRHGASALLPRPESALRVSQQAGRWWRQEEKIFGEEVTGCAQVPAVAEALASSPERSGLQRERKSEGCRVSPGSTLSPAQTERIMPPSSPCVRAYDVRAEHRPRSSEPCEGKPGELAELCSIDKYLLGTLCLFRFIWYLLEESRGSTDTLHYKNSFVFICCLVKGNKLKLSQRATASEDWGWGQDFKPGATKDMGKMLGGEEEKDPDAQKKEEERQEALRQQEEERKAKHARMEAEREKVRQQIRDKYGLKKKEEKEAEEKAALEQPCEGSLTRPKKAIPAGCGDEEEEEEESILDTVLKYLPGPLQDMFKK
ncbi:hypothetical protein MJG53_008000 [Ovis ammon polii x Ovis aries]|uniref:Uncharacterized protein n=1 Tax=Ovis ammon polii x Ovis aries TaxID=2918886 RepID=A0ACB9UZA0_9CETA|nr:hypothetical protein MJG53_008000 [Ovis ammon polii x Ovis aries]